MIFLPTPSVRRATAGPTAGELAEDISTHALREEGDLLLAFEFQTKTISTHALREEGDWVYPQ